MPHLLTLEAFVPAAFVPSPSLDAALERLWQEYGTQVAVDFPSPKTQGCWRLTNLGWVGQIPLTPDVQIALQPKLPLGNLFGMLEVAYRLTGFRFLDGEMACASLAEFYERLAHVLARRVLDRERQGLYRAYVAQEAALPYVAGRLDVRRQAQRPWAAALPCEYGEHTADVDDNQIIAWTLHRILQSGLCTERSLPALRQAYRGLAGGVALTPFAAQECVGRLYGRLNADYQPLHALCRFFLEHTGPAHTAGDHTLAPFLIPMPRLFELFVAEWLRQHLPPERFRLEAQERVTFGPEQQWHFDIDLTLYDAATNQILGVLDTKYKAADSPATDDIAQIVAYAEIKGCREAALVYPAPLARPLEARLGDIHVRSLTFALDGDLTAAGQAFVACVADGTRET